MGRFYALRLVSERSELGLVTSSHCGLERALCPSLVLPDEARLDETAVAHQRQPGDG